ncbi:MAG TPA: SLBB domain-containing protein, partial [Abditibacteriaceae bacterium]
AQEYRLGPGDVISVTVLRHAEMSVDGATVTTDGKVQLPVAGAVQVAGKTIAQATALIRTRLKARLLRPEVTVSVKQARPRQISVLGVVARPGIYESKAGWRVSDAIATAGGLTARQELVGGSLTHADGKSVALNIAKILSRTNDQKVNLALQAGDTLRFNARTIQVRVAGQVQRPGFYDVPVGEGAVEAVSLAGGALPRAALTKTTINRADGKVIEVDLYSVLVLGKKESNVPLKEGDLVLLPESSGRVTVTGAVQRPGYYNLDDGRNLRVGEAVALAGGTTERAAMTKAVVTKTDGTLVPVDLFRVLVQNDPVANVTLATGDVLTVPDARGITVLGTVQKPGTYIVEEGGSPRVADVLALAGGLSVKPDAGKITLLRNLQDGKQQVLDIDPVALIERGDASQNALVRDGDLVNVSSTIRTVYVNGEVRSPGSFEVTQGESVAELITKAGGVTDKAALTTVMVKRGAETHTVNLFPALREGKRLDFALQAGDFVVVPENMNRVLVLPAVNKPGLVYIPENGQLTLGEAIGLAGGPLPSAKIKEIGLFRIGPAGLERRIIPLDRVENGQLALSVPLKGGDYIYVPPGRTSPSLWQTITGALSTAMRIGGGLF